MAVVNNQGVYEPRNGLSIKQNIVQDKGDANINLVIKI
jgi:hypothetical protein